MDEEQTLQSICNLLSLCINVTLWLNSQINIMNIAIKSVNIKNKTNLRNFTLILSIRKINNLKSNVFRKRDFRYLILCLNDLL